MVLGVVVVVVVVVVLVVVVLVDVVLLVVVVGTGSSLALWRTTRVWPPAAGQMKLGYSCQASSPVLTSG